MRDRKMILCLVALFVHLLFRPGHAANAEIPYFAGLRDTSRYHLLFDGDFIYDRVNLTFSNGDIIASGALMSEYAGDEQDVVIPATLGGMDVVAVEGFLFNYTVKNVILPESTVMIGDSAFGYCSELESVLLPDRLQFIGNNAFKNCQKLKPFDLPHGLEGIGSNAFLNCWSLESIKLPDTLKFLGSFAFQRCSSLASLTLPSSLEEIENNENPFLRCPAQISVAENHPFLFVEDGVLFDREKNVLISYPYDSPVREYSVPEGITIGPSAFFSVKNLSLLQLPADMAQTETNLFVHTSAEFEVSPENPAMYARDGVLFDKAENRLIAYPFGSARTSYIIPEGTLAIGKEAFSGCSQLTELLFPNTVSMIGSDAFVNCRGLTEITLPDQIKTIGSGAFMYCTGLQKAVLPNGLEELGRGAFFNCESLETVILPESLKTLNAGTFARCKNLKEIILPSGLSLIDPDAFQDMIHDDPPLLIVTKGSYAEKWAKENKAAYRYTPVVKDNKISAEGNASAELRVGSRGQAVLDMKQRFFELGYFNTANFNDMFTDKTAETVKQFEKNNGLPVDGVADPEMLRVLFSSSAVGK